MPDTTERQCELCGYTAQPVCDAPDGIWYGCTLKVCGHFQKIPNPGATPAKPAQPLAFQDYTLKPPSIWDRLRVSFNTDCAIEFNHRNRWEELYLPDPETSPSGTLLDIGAGDLRWSERALSAGWSVKSHHTDPATVEAWKKRGLDVSLGFPDWKSCESDSFGAVLIRWALEQCSDPIDFLREAWRALKPGGRLIIIAWNVRSLGHEMYKEAWLPLHAAQHHNLYSLSSLRRSLRAAEIHSKLTMFTSFAGQLPESITPNPSQNLEELKRTALLHFKEQPLSGEALILVCNKPSNTLDPLEYET